MAKLIAKFPTDGLLPISGAGCTLDAVSVAAITSITASPGQTSKVSDRMKKVLGTGFPAPCRATGKEGGRAIWTEPDQCFWLGPAPKQMTGASMTDQSDGWTVLRLTGPIAVQVLARLTPTDLRPIAFKRGHTARTQLGHMLCSITRVGENSFDIMVFRSMTQTAVNELSHVMQTQEARAQLS